MEGILTGRLRRIGAAFVLRAAVLGGVSVASLSVPGCGRSEPDMKAGYEKPYLDQDLNLAPLEFNLMPGIEINKGINFNDAALIGKTPFINIKTSHDLLKGEYDEPLENLANSCRSLKSVFLSIDSATGDPDMEAKSYRYVRGKFIKAYGAGNATWAFSTYVNDGKPYLHSYPGDSNVDYVVINGDFPASFNSVLRQDNLPKKPMLIRIDRKDTPEERKKMRGELSEMVAEYLVEKRFGYRFNGPLREQELGSAKKLLSEKIQNNGMLEGLIFPGKFDGISLCVKISDRFELDLPEYLVDQIVSKAKYSVIPPYTVFKRASSTAALDRDYYTAVSQLEDVAARCPGSDLAMAAFLRIGVIYEDYLHDYDNAIRYYQMVADSRSMTAWAANALFEIGKIRGEKLFQREEAVETLRTVINQFPENKHYIEWAKKYIEQYDKPVDPAKILKYCKLRSAENCQHILDSNVDEEQKALANFYLGNIYFSRRDYVKALEQYIKFINSGQKKEIAANAYFYAGRSLKYLGRGKEAIRYLIEAEKRFEDKFDRSGYYLLPHLPYPPIIRGYNLIFPDHVVLTRAYIDYELGRLYFAVEKDTQSARKHLLRAKETAFNYGPFLYLIANAFAYDLKDNDQALEIFNRIKQIERNDELIFQRGNFYAAAGKDTRRALDDFLEIIHAPKPQEKLAQQAHNRFVQRGRIAVGYLYLNKFNDFEKAKLMWEAVEEDSRESALAKFMIEINQNSTKYEIEKGIPLTTEISTVIYTIKETGEKYTLVLLHDLPATYIKGTVNLGNWVLHAEYDDGFEVEFNPPEMTLHENNLILSAMKKIPPGFFERAKIVISNFYHPAAAGTYSEETQSVELFPEGRSITTLQHELVHYYDLGLTGNWFDPFDLSVLFRRINFYQIGRNFRVVSNDFRDFTIKYLSISHPFDRPQEEFTYFAGDQYLPGRRLYVKTQMEAGNYEPALKYLFMRYLTPFDGREYEVGDNNSSLGFEEVRDKLNRRQLNAPNSAYTYNHELLKQMMKMWRHEDDYTCESKVSFLEPILP
ncbi:MAG: tetratricopeptide repeat protein [Candidatus Margulisiibacteriota bacterium]